MTARRLPEDVAQALVAALDDLDGAGVPAALGGSGMLALLGYRTDVGDVDLVVPAGSQQPVAGVVAGWSGEMLPGGPDPWHSTFRAAGTVRGIPIDILGGFAMRVGGDVVRFPFRRGRRVAAAGRYVHLAPARMWIAIYDRVDPMKAAFLRSKPETSLR